MHTILGWSLGLGFLIFGFIFFVPPLRTALATRPLLSWLIKMRIFPRISRTESEALEAGDIWVEREFFSGKPDLNSLLSVPSCNLSAAERAFLDGPVNELCALLDDWEIWKERGLSKNAWEFMLREKFLGIIIPKAYGGLGFSSLAHSEIIRKIATRSQVASIYVMVPNSLGPAELLIHYGTPEQKRYYLPRLADGTEIPCFALTEPLAGSDAASITSEGTVFKGNDGHLFIRLNWEKRWITLASISTVIGLAFRLKDPERLLHRESGETKDDLGITCALVPTHAPGVVVGRRHDPLGMPFHNCPTSGKDVVIPVEAIIGGVTNAGKGWKMLMECLAAGRGISFPAQCVGGAQLVTRVVSAHAMVRQQFGLSIGFFEGVQDPLAEIAAFTYILDGLRRYTLSGLTEGLQPSVITAISKYYSTEIYRKVINHGMDVMGGAGISLGPKNLIAHSYLAAPIAITVEGANILSRSLIIFGQGALRAHPYALKEMKAAKKRDWKEFDAAFWPHVGHFVRNCFRSVLLSVTRGWLVILPGAPNRERRELNRYLRKIAWASASFAILADIAMLSLGRKLKSRESITGRFADLLAYMYIGTATLRRFELEGSRKEQLPLLRYSMGYILGELETAFDGIFANLEVPGLTWLFRYFLRAWSNVNSLGGRVSDADVHRCALLLLEDSSERDALGRGMYYPSEESEQLFKLDRAFIARRNAEGPELILRQAVKDEFLKEAPLSELITLGEAKGVITPLEAQHLREWESLRREVVQVDSFTEDEYHHRPAEVQRLRAG